MHKKLRQGATQGAKVPRVLHEARFFAAFRANSRIVHRWSKPLGGAYYIHLTMGARYNIIPQNALKIKGWGIFFFAKTKFEKVLDKECPIVIQ